MKFPLSLLCCFVFAPAIKSPASDATDVVAIYNEGLRLQNEGKHAESFAKFKEVLKHRPADWKARAKAIQEAQALGNFEARDAEHKALASQKNNAGSGPLAEAVLFCRDQFSAGGEKVMALECFELGDGDRPLRYSFVVLGKKGAKSSYRITLGSYPTTTEQARIEGDIGADEVVFHLDGYYRSGKHETYAFFTGEPGYDEVRKMVIEILEGKREAISSTTPDGEGGTEVEIKSR